MEIGRHVLLRTPGDFVKIALITEESNMISLGRFGSFDITNLIGKPYGVTFELMPDQSLKVLSRADLLEDEEVDDFENAAGHSNREIFDNGQSQKLSHEEIERMKNQDISGGIVVKALCENNSSFAKKTDLSKLKYIKRKKDKFLKRFTALEPNLRNLCEYYTERHQSKVRDLRMDSLSLMLGVSNVHAMSRILVVDDVHGLLLAAVASRMDGGEIVALHDGQTQVHPAAFCVNISKQQRQAIKWLPWNFLGQQMQSDAGSFVAEQEERLGKMKNDKRKESVIGRIKRLSDAWETLQRAPFDGLLMATKFNPIAVLQKLDPFLGPSKPVVIHSGSLEILSETFMYMRTSPRYLNTQMCETWYREYKVLPSRTRPLNEMSPSGGYVLHSTAVIPPTPQKPAECEMDAAPIILENESVHQPKRQRLIDEEEESPCCC